MPLYLIMHVMHITYLIWHRIVPLQPFTWHRIGGTELAAPNWRHLIGGTESAAPNCPFSFIIPRRNFWSNFQIDVAWLLVLYFYDFVLFKLYLLSCTALHLCIYTTFGIRHSKLSLRVPSSICTTPVTKCSAYQHGDRRNLKL